MLQEKFVLLVFMGLIAEEFLLNVDNLGLFKSIEETLMNTSPAVRSPAVSGWALQGYCSSHLEGWASTFCPYNGPENKSPSWNPLNDYESTLKSIQEYREFTNVCNDSFKYLILRLVELGLCPRKSRIIKLAKKSFGQWHQDGSKQFYQVRLHIPLVTNDSCFFENENGRMHMPCNGNAFFVHINRAHRVFNLGEQDRYHFVCNIWDQHRISKHHQYIALDNFGLSFHPPGNFI